MKILYIYIYKQESTKNASDTSTKLKSMRVKMKRESSSIKSRCKLPEEERDVSDAVAVDRSTDEMECFTN